MSSRIRVWKGAEPTHVLLAPDTEAVSKISLNDNYILYLTRNGKIFISSSELSNDSGKLQEMLSTSNYIIIDVACGDQLLFVDINGKVYKVCERNNKHVIEEITVREPSEFCSHGYEVQGSDVRVKTIDMGAKHTLYLAENGEIWVDGSGPQLGLFTQKESGVVAHPVKLKFFQGRDTLSICCGSNFSVALVRSLECENDSDFKFESEVGTPVTTCPTCHKERLYTHDAALLHSDEKGRCPFGLPISSSVDKLSECSEKQASLQNSSVPTPTQEHSTQSTEVSEDQSQEINRRISSSSGDTSSIHTKDDSTTTSPLSHDCSIGKLISGVDDSKQISDSEDSDPTVEIKKSGIFGNTEAARQFITRQLSWITTSSGETNTETLTSYLADSTREILKENVSNVANFVYEGVKTVGDKVGILSRHFSSEKNPDDSKSLDACIDLELKSMTYQLSLDLPGLERKLMRTGSCNLPTVQEKLLCHTSFPSLRRTGERPSLSTDLLLVRAEDLVRSGKMLLSTQVWTWGSSDHGQLGVGDMLDRPQPNCVRTLASCGVVKVASGSHHSLALTLDGQVFSWGDNKHRKCSPESRPTFSTPKKVALPKGQRAKDIAAGSDFSLILTDVGQVIHMGKRRAGSNGSGMTELSDLSCYCSDGDTILKVFASGDICACVWEPEKVAAEEFLRSEKSFLQLCLATHQTLVKPLLVEFEENNAQKQLLKAFGKCMALVACNIKSLTQCIVEGREITSILPVKCVEECIVIFKDYSRALCNATSVNVFQLPKNEINWTEKLDNLISDFGIKCDSKQSSEIFHKLMKKPLKRLKVYHEKVNYILEFLDKNIENKKTEDCLKQCKSKWNSVAESEEKKYQEAELTSSFWDSRSIKLIESYKTPERRLVRESHAHPISLAYSGRFSSHWLILLNDVLIDLGYSAYVAYSLHTVWMESLQDTASLQHAITLTTPEDVLTLYCASTTEKIEWFQAFQNSIKSTLGIRKDNKFQVTPPLVRSATYTFTKAVNYKDACYTGQWLCGKLHGRGELLWPDGKKYCGQFKQNLSHGYGIQVIPGNGGSTIYEGNWMDGKMQGHGMIRYPNGNVYEGNLKDSLPHGHGIFKQGQFVASAASIYIGEWEFGVKRGYGVMDDILVGEKHMGLWQNDAKHGSGMIVTLDGMYYEGTFVQNKMMGMGMMIFEDGTFYEGEFGAVGIFAGKGTLTFGNGDSIEGSFHGAWNEGVKMNGTLRKSVFSNVENKNVPNLLGKLCVPSDRKWEAIFCECREILGIPSNVRKANNNNNVTSTQRIWENVAIAVNKLKQSSRLSTIQSSKKDMESSDGLERIPQVQKEHLELTDYKNIRDYLEKAFESPVHPLGDLMKSLVCVYNATYGGVRVHPQLLTHAVDELHSLTCRLYSIIALLFPSLPPDGEEVQLVNGQDDSVVVTVSALLHPFMMPRVHSSLFMLYALHNKHDDDKYWERLLKWNKQTDLALMSFLSVDQKFWGLDDPNDIEEHRSVSTVRDHHFMDAVEMLQQLKTTFTPMEKLHVIRSTFQELSKRVQYLLGESYSLTMDDLFPLFLYIVVRSRILQLGSEIQLIEDFMEPYLMHGELDIMFTTLKACYWQILRETLNVGS